MAPLTTLFVYGTLKRGGVNAALLRDQHFLRPAVTRPLYRLVDLGPFPGLVCDDHTGVAVHGELWAVSACALAELDDFETSTDEYARGPIEVEGADGPVDGYFYVGPVAPAARFGDRWPME